MPTLHWIGKDKVINHHLDVPFKVLEHAYGFDNGTQTEQETNSGNKIIHGDNLEALKSPRWHKYSPLTFKHHAGAWLPLVQVFPNIPKAQCWCMVS